jgi:hypothetical protein
MQSRLRNRKPTKAPALRSWRVVLLRNRGELLGYVDAVDPVSAEGAAVRAFNLSSWQSRRLLVREHL